MCTLIFAWNLFDDVPLIAAANREEYYDRPARPPAVLDLDPAIVAPVDERAGGTWIGCNEHGVFVAITNRQSDVDGDRSRGLLVLDSLRKRSATEAVRTLQQELNRRRYAGFNLVIVDESIATIFEWDGHLNVIEVESGVHIVVNAGYIDPMVDNGRVWDVLATEPPERSNGWLDLVAASLKDHDNAICIHGDTYGTRSSSLIEIQSSGQITYRFADGPPCATPYRECFNGIL